MPFSLSNFMAGAGKGMADVGQTMVNTAITKKAELDLLAVREQSENAREARRMEHQSRENALGRTHTSEENEKSRIATKEEKAADRGQAWNIHKDNLGVQNARLANEGLSVQTTADGTLGILSPDGTFKPARDAQGNPVTGQKDLSTAVKAKLDVNTKMIEANLKAAANEYDPAKKEALMADVKRLEAETNALIGLGGGTPSPSQLKIGDIHDGYKFKGGNARDPSSWEPVSAPSGANGRKPDPATQAPSEARDAFGGDKGGAEYMKSVAAIKQQFDADIATLPDKDLESKYITSGLYKRLSADRQSRLFKKTENLRLLRR